MARNADRHTCHICRPAIGGQKQTFPQHLLSPPVLSCVPLRLSSHLCLRHLCPGKHRCRQDEAAGLPPRLPTRVGAAGESKNGGHESLSYSSASTFTSLGSASSSIPSNCPNILSIFSSAFSVSRSMSSSSMTSGVINTIISLLVCMVA